MALPHEVLGVAANADELAINAAFRRAAKRFHPDLNNGDTSGIRCLQGLIAARDFLISPGWRAVSAPQAGSLLPSRGKKWITRSVVLTFAAAATCSFLVLTALSPGEARDIPLAAAMPPAGAMGVSVVKKSGMANARMPNAGPAKIEPIRDSRRVAAGPRLEANRLTGRLLQASAKRSASPPVDGAGKAVKGAANLMAQAYHRIAPEL